MVKGVFGEQRAVRYDSLRPTKIPELLQKLTQIIWQHFAPPDPVVVDVVAPDVEAVRDAF